MGSTPIPSVDTIRPNRPLSPALGSPPPVRCGDYKNVGYYTTARCTIHTLTVKAPFLFLVVKDELSTSARLCLANEPT